LTLTRKDDVLEIELTMRRKDGTVHQEPCRFLRYEP